MFQPPNSPDFNVLDLAIFAAIQLFQYHESSTNVDELIFAVRQCVKEMPNDKLNNIFLSLQMALESVTKVGGGNIYKLAHIGKDQPRRKIRLAVTIVCSGKAILRHVNLSKTQSRVNK